MNSAARGTVFVKREAREYRRTKRTKKFILKYALRSAIKAEQFYLDSLGNVEEFEFERKWGYDMIDDLRRVLEKMK
jgi:hypothetical protein